MITLGTALIWICSPKFYCMHQMSSKMDLILQLCCLLDFHILYMPLVLVNIIQFLNPWMETCNEASLMAVTLAMVLSPIQSDWQPTKRTCPCLFFPMKAIPCHCLFFAPTTTIRMMSCQSFGNWFWFLVLLEGIGMLACCWCCLYLFIKD